MDREEYKKIVEATFDDVSCHYDENRFFSISASKMAALVPPAERLKILDLSTGTGGVAIAIAGRHPDAVIEAVNPMVDIRKAERAKKIRMALYPSLCFGSPLGNEAARFDQ